MSSALYWVLVTASVLAPCLVESAELKKQTTIYKALVEYLLKGDYEPLAMPVCGKKEPLNVKMDMWLYQLFDLDEPTQMLTIDVWTEMSWRDCGLVWDPKKFNDVDQLTIPASDIWKPDIIYYQSLHGNFEEGMFIFRESVARIRYDGMVQLGCQALLKSFCRVDVRRFPFDSHKCNITFASWNKDATIFNLTKRDEDNSNRGHAFSRSSNGEWDVLGFPAFNSMGRFAVGVDESVVRNYTEVTFQLHLRRKPLYTRLYLIFPCLLLTWVAGFVFILPIDSGEKVALSVTILLSLIVFLLLVAENIPRSSDGIPILGIFFSMCIGLVCFAVLLTCLVLNVGYKEKDICMPRCLRSLLRSPIAKIFCFQYSEEHPQKWIVLRQRKKKNAQITDSQGDESGKMVATPESENLGSLSDTPSNNRSERNEWRFLAILLDRIFMVVYYLLTIATTIYIQSF